MKAIDIPGKFTEAYVPLVLVSLLLALPQLLVGGFDLYWTTLLQPEWGKVRMLLAFGYTAGWWKGTRGRVQ